VYESADAMKVLHVIPEERWPTAEEARAALLFSPLALARGVALRTRSWVPAMVPWRATEGGEVTPAVVDWYARFADGRPGALVVEATGVRDVPSGPLLRASHDRYVDGLARVADAVRARSGGETRCYVQLIDFLAIRRRPEPLKYFERFLAVTAMHRAALAARHGDPGWRDAPERAVREALAALDDDALADALTPRELEALRMGARERVTDVALPHVRDLPRVLPEVFAEAARRVERAGFDGVELHCAHAYTLASFLSARNDRGDGYGGDRAGRVRLPLEVFRAVRGALRDDTVVGCRILGDEVIPGGSGVDDAMYYATRLAAEGMDFISVSKGGKFEDAKPPKVGEAAYPYTGESGHECMPTVRSDARGPFGRNLHLARAVRAAVRGEGWSTPVVGAGGIVGFQQAEAALRDGDCDLVGAARQSLADPDWWAKVRAGRGAEVRRCKLTNYCEALDQRHKEVTCQRWDRAFDPREDPAAVPRAADGRRRLTAPPWDATSARVPEEGVDL
jgi:2,4-dienoyl-CoA reductase-like NADH-dependent reductase (Old Yellow Enzyme family)